MNKNERNPNFKPDTKQVNPKNFERVEKEGKEFSTQNKNPQIERDLEGEDEPQPYHDLQGSDDRGIGRDKTEGPRDSDNRH